MERVGDHDEMRCLVGGVGVDRAGEHLRLVRDDRDGIAAEMGQRADDRRAELRLHLEPVRTVEHDVEHRAHVVHAAVAAGHDVEQFRRGPRLARLVGGRRRRVRPRARREVRQVAPDVVEDRFVVFGEVVDHPAGQRDAGPAEVLLRNLFARRLFHDRRTCREDRALAAHDGEVAHRRNQRAVPGRRAEQAGHGRDLAGALRLGEQIGGGAAVMLSAGPEAGTLEKHHQRDLVAQRQLGEAIALGVAAGADAAREGGEVLGADHHR